MSQDYVRLPSRCKDCANVIKIDGVCYKCDKKLDWRVFSPDHTWNDVENTYDHCETCELPSIRYPECQYSVVMSFIDEADTVYYPTGYAAWDFDVARWYAMIADKGTPPPTAVYEVSGSTSGIIPNGRDYPNGIEKFDINRNPSLNEFKAAVEQIVGDNPAPTQYYFLIDSSGSMTRNSLNPGLSEFEAELRDQGFDYSEVLNGNERWLSWTIDTVENIPFPEVILLPREKDKELEEYPEVLSYDSKCFEKEEFSTLDPDVLWNQIDDEFDSCEDCQSASIKYEACNLCLGDPSIFVSVSGENSLFVSWLGEAWNLPDDSGDEREVCGDIYFRALNKQYATHYGFPITRYTAAQSFFGFGYDFNICARYSIFYVPSLNVWSNSPWSGNIGQGGSAGAGRSMHIPTYSLGYISRTRVGSQKLPYSAQRPSLVGWQWASGRPANPYAFSNFTNYGMNNSTVLGNDYKIADWQFGSTTSNGVTFSWQKGNNWPE